MLSREKLEYASTVGYGHQLRELNDDLSSVCDYLRSANVGHVVVLSMRLRTDSLRFYVHGIWRWWGGRAGDDRDIIVAVAIVALVLISVPLVEVGKGKEYAECAPGAKNAQRIPSRTVRPTVPVLGG